MSDFLIEIAEQLANDYPDAGLDADQWMKLIVSGPFLISKAAIMTCKMDKEFVEYMLTSDIALNNLIVSARQEDPDD